MIPLLTDTHLDSNNIEVTHQVFSACIEWAKQRNIFNVIHAGDVFVSRKAQSLDTLVTFGQILDEFHKSGMTLHIIPGNHDKVSYFDDISYLHVFQHHPGLKLYEEGAVVCIENHNFLLVPFWDESIYSTKFNELVALHTHPNVDWSNVTVITHIAIDGVCNNDGSVTKGVPISLFDGFRHTYVGHYHNVQRLSDSILYVGSSWSHTFGDHTVNGVYIIDDGDGYWVDMGGNRHTTVTVRSALEIESVLAVAKNQPLAPREFVKVIVNAPSSELALINPTELAHHKIQCDFRSTSDLSVDVNDTVNIADLSFGDSNRGLIALFESFCNQEGLSVEEGLYFLKLQQS